MSSSAWADYLDARLRLVHQWAAAGILIGEMTRRLTPSPAQLLLALRSAVEPPLPGCSRSQASEWRRRVSELEEELHARAATPETDRSRRDAELLRSTHVRALMSHPDPAECGCRYWADASTAGKHHCNCAYAEDPW